MERARALPAHRRLIIFLLLVLCLTSLISPWLALGADFIAAHWPGLLSERVSFPKVFNRAFMVSGVLLFIACRRWLIPPGLKELLSTPPALGARDLLSGFSLAVGSMVLLLAVMTWAGVYTPFFRLSVAESVSRFASGLLAGGFAGTLEEIFFRGILFKGLYDAGRPLRAYLFANLFYSALHFVKPEKSFFMEGFDLTLGFRHLATTFQPFFEIWEILPGIFGLFLIGVALSFALVRTGKLYLAIGLHAGWVLALKTIRVFGDYSRADLGWYFGDSDPKIVSGVATWIGVALVCWAVYWITKRRAVR